MILELISVLGMELLVLISGLWFDNMFLFVLNGNDVPFPVWRWVGSFSPTSCPFRCLA